MWPKQQLLTATAVIGICLLAIATATTATATAIPATTSATSSAVLATTTSVPLPLQPPTGPQNVTSTTSSHKAQAGDEAEAEAQAKKLHLTEVLAMQQQLSDSAKELNRQALAPQPAYVEEDLNYDSELELESESVDEPTTEFVGVPGFLPTLVPPQENNTTKPANGHGYIQFEVDAEKHEQSMKRPQAAAKSATVNEVLSNLFPNGFSDIFRFSYPSESSTEPVRTAVAEPSSTTTATTTAKAVGPATTPLTLLPTTAAAAATANKNQTYYSYQTTVTKEYRRELRPGHTEIVVEKIEHAPIIAGDSAEHFKDGSNHISKDELLRINRAAVDAPVLPSLLLRPENDEETLVAAESAPIIILGDQETDLDDNQSIEDNQIAESQHLGQQLYEHRLPPPHGSESYSSQQGPGMEQQINVHIVHDETLNKVQQQAAGETAAKEADKPSQELDHFQSHSEQRFQQRHQTQEAPSRQFLKTFKPMVSGNADGPIPKGIFHYEVNNPPQRSNARPATANDYAAQFVRPAAQVAYQRELSHVQQQQQQSQPSQNDLHTQAIASAAPQPAPLEYHNLGGPTPLPATPTPSSILYVTLSTPSPAQLPQEPPLLIAPAPVPQPPAHVGASPHDYVSEAAAEPSQHHVQHAPAPEVTIKPKTKGFTFVEVQKSVNIHNKLITEKDGRLVEQHETIYHQLPLQQNQNHITADYSPKDYVASAVTAAPTPAATNYVSLAANPINVQNVDYDSAPQEGAISHAAVQFESTHEQSHHPVIQPHVPAPSPVTIVEKLVPQPYAVPVHVEHYVDRPYPVQTIVEQPVPYPIETVVEKIVEKHVPVEVERIVEKPVEVEKIVERFIDRPLAIPIHVPVAIHMPMPPAHHGFPFAPHPNALPPWSSHSHAHMAHIPPKVLQNYYARMLKKLLPQLTVPSKTSTMPPTVKVKPKLKPPTKPIRGDAPKVATFSLADMRYDLRPPPLPQGSHWLQGSRYIYNTLPDDLATAAASAPTQMVKSYIGPVAATNAPGNEFDEFQRWRNGHSLKRSPDFGRNLQMEYGFKPPLVPSMEIDDKGNPLKTDAEPQ